MKKTAPLFVLIAGCLWGSMGIFVRGLGSYGFTSLEIGALRVFGALLFLGTGIFLYKKELLRIRLKDLWCFIGTGIISIVFFNYCYFTTIQLTSLSVAAVLLYTAPVIVTALGIFLFREKYHAIKMIALIMAFVGCVLVTGILSQKLTLSAGGIWLGLGAGFGYAMYSIFGRYAIQRGYESLTISFYTFLFACFGFFPLVDVKHMVSCLKPEWECVGLITGLVVLNTVIAYLTYTIGLTHMEAGRASILASIEPVVATLIGFFLYKEKLSWMTFLGVILVLGSAVIVNLKPKHMEK
ncbi:MAG: EamA family transporter [Lachnospiraceae bacterium]|nr:EamA family transporter [Lachnospiraceae bacterium]